jgi:hypothetical protein
MVADEPRWSVAEAAWKDLLPDLPDEVIALLATPVVASVDGPPEDEDEERYPSPTEPCATAWRSGDRPLQPHGDRIARFLAPGEAPPAVPV